MNKIFPKILAFSFALIIPLTAFLITTNQKNVSASDKFEDFDRIDFYEFFDDTYFNELDTDSILRGSGSSVKFKLDNYQYSPTLNIPYLSNDFILADNRLIYDYTIHTDYDIKTYYRAVRTANSGRYMSMYYDTPIKSISFDFNNLVLFYYDDDKNLDKSEFVDALSHYFSFISFAVNQPTTDVDVDINISGCVADLSGDRNIRFDTYLYSENYEYVYLSDTHYSLEHFFNNLYDCYGEIDSDFSTSRLNGNLIDFTKSNVLNYCNSYFIVPNINITFNFYSDYIFYLRSKLYHYKWDDKYANGNYTNLYDFNLYRPDFINTILGYYGYESYYNGYNNAYDKAYNKGYNKGYTDGAGELTPFDAILETVESFLNFKIFPKFPIYYFFLIAFGFALFGLILKYAKGG